ncbi:MAG: beta-ketoacyl synthase N-terminal-like domain-containing protein [Candidatus Poseidoniaceae archaeon]|nr:beta-ketoacyl synthase N-terminal-like domain-containing protein [Candidatus Poseidoniaceae archaeon]
MITTRDGKPCDGLEQYPFEPIAVVGMAALMPDAKDIEQFWQNIIDAHVSIKEVPKERWDPQIYWENGEPGKVTEGKTYSKIGAFVEGYEFDWRRWRQPPGTLPQIDPCQLWAVTVSASAIENAGYGEGGKDFDRASCGVIFANALGGENRSESNIRVYSAEVRKIAIDNGATPEQADAMVEQICEGKPRIDEDTMPGELANVVSGRVANLLDLQGPNYSTDAACASSMAAILDACKLLQSRQVDTMLAGATDRCMEAPTYAKFSAIGALSSSHSTPFDARANGFVMGEGAGVLLLKRLSDAIQDEDDIKAVIRGVGGSSDGRGKGITAPSQRGQVQAVSRAYNQAGYEPSTVELVEAHGTSTKVGDATELSTLSLLWSGLDGGDHVAVGSVKSQIGHLKAAAGIAGIMKACNSVYHATIPPSAGFVTPNPTVEWDKIPFFVPTQARDWPEPENNPRRAGVSAFGFGGTNFHIAIEGYSPEFHSKIATHWEEKWREYSGKKVNSDSILDVSANPSLTHEELKSVEGGLLLISGSNVDEVKEKLQATNTPSTNFDNNPKGKRLSKELSESWDYTGNDPVRMAVIATSWVDFDKKKELAIKSLDDKAKWGFLASQGVLVTDDPPLPHNAKIAHMYPGQGSQYVGMTLDLHTRFSGVGEVWEKSDKTMVEVLDGETLSSFVLRNNLSKEELVESEYKLKQTEYTQPAMLTADLAIESVLNAHGYVPDMVAGHSLGEYAALMSAGILDMDGALRAAAARGTEMGSVEIEDKGLMASITAPYTAIEEILGEVEGYVIAANKNSPKMTVIAGETEPMKAAIKRFESEGYQCVILQTSHAFHSKIVAPANEPLRRFLENIDINWPKIPITSNFDGGWYPMNDGSEAKPAILSKLAPQMASSVEWTTQIESMYAAGARVFIEVGPKRALTVFASQILEEKDGIPIMTNHPKAGGISTLLTAMGNLALAGRVPKWPSDNSSHLTEAFRAGPIEAYVEVTNSIPATPLKQRAKPLPSGGGNNNSSLSIRDSEIAILANPDQSKEILVGELIASRTGYPVKMCKGAIDMRKTLGMLDSDIQEIITIVNSQCETDPEWDVSKATTIADITRWIITAPQIREQIKINSVDKRTVDPYVVTGISLGLPGGDKVFDEDNFEKLIRGETCISEVSDEYKQRLLDKNIVRLIKNRDGSVGMEAATEFGDIPQLAGLRGGFDPAEEFGIDPKVLKAWDISTQLACAAGLLALRDAGIPLTPVEQVGKGGLRLIRSWEIPSVYRERTGIVFSSCFAGHQMAAKHAKSGANDGEGNFDRRYLFQILNMGHSQFAQYIGARGPNTTINLACASATAAFGVAEDWLNSDRCDRVIIISADDVTNDDLWEWIGGGFAASGAASTSNIVEDAALPFDKRRDGLVLGMGAAAFVVERKSQSDARGVQPIAELLGTMTANSAFHGTRLDVNHVAQTVNHFIAEMEGKWGLDRSKMAPKTVFFSHETYTPARGGSAQAEVKALRETFGDSTDALVIANTKGFTGHPMGVGIEDASMFHGLNTGMIPPIANHKEVDPELGDLNLSKGGNHSNLKYGMRFAAGFGSQIALSLVRKYDYIGERIDKSKLLSWNQSLAGTNNIQLRILQNKLVAYVDGENNLHGGIQGDEYAIANIEPTSSQIVIEVEPEPEPEPKLEPELPKSVNQSGITPVVIEVVVAHTGYPADFVELDQDLEGELGIDTVKQAEIMADIREKFNLPVDEDFILSDYPTLNHFVSYIQRMTGGEVLPTLVPSTTEEEDFELPTEPVAPVESKVEVSDEGGIKPKLIAVVVKHTGYPEDFIEMDQDLEGELGIDTVKQAEIMGDVREIFSLPVDEDFVLADHPTLNHFVSYIQRMTGGEVLPTLVPSTTEEEDFELPTEPEIQEVIASEPIVEPIQIESSTNTRRWQVEVEPCPAISDPLPVSGTIVLTQDIWGVADALAVRLKERGLSIAKIGFEYGAKSVSEQEELSGHTYRADPGSAEQIAEICSQLEGIGGVIHLAPLSLADSTWELEGASNQVNLSCQSWFGLLKGLDSKLAPLSIGLVGSVTALDGRHGNLGERFNSLQCGASGVTKSYSFERENIRCRALDLHPEIIIDSSKAAEIIEREMFGIGGEIEIGIDRDNRRWTLVNFAEDLVEERHPLRPDDIWLVSGGGSGVTAASIIGVSNESKNSGATFILLGRSKLIEETSGWLNWTDEQLNHRKATLRETLISESENGKVTIVEWNNAWTKMTRSRDIYRTMNQIKSVGNYAEYHSVDVTDSAGIISVVNGRSITGIVHGAGLEESKLVSDKTWNKFDLVVRVKVDGWKSLVSAAGESLRFACSFTSVAGRFGNGGQTDYAAGNSILDAEMARLTASGKCRAVAIGWTGWRDVGMATRGSIEAVFEAAGIETLAVNEGVNIFVGEALAGGKRRVIGCGSLGLMDRFNSFREAPLKLPAAMAASIADPRRFPLIDKLLSVNENQSLVSQCTLSLKNHPFLSDHAIEGVPYHPGVMALEMFAENALLMLPGHCLAGFEQVTFGLPVKIMKGSMNVRVESMLEKSEGDLRWVHCKLVSDLTNSKGEVFGEPRLHHEARVRLIAKCDDLCPFLQGEVDQIPEVGTPADGELLHHASFIYLRYFHGPRFQSHGGVIRGVEEGVDGIALMRHQLPATDQFAAESSGEEVLLEALPMLIEAGFQNAGLAAMESDGYSSLPIGIDWSTMLRVPERDEKLRMRSLKVSSEDTGITVHDVVIVGDDDAPVLALKGLRLKAMGQVPDDQKFTLSR